MGCDHTLNRGGMLDAQMIVAEAARYFEPVAHHSSEPDVDLPLVGRDLDPLAGIGDRAA